MLIVAAVLVIFGLASPLLAKLTPDLLKPIPQRAGGIGPVLIPTPTVADAVSQYLTGT